MQISRRSVSVAASVSVLCSSVLLVVLLACSPAAAKKSADQPAAKTPVQVAQTLQADVAAKSVGLAANLAGDAPAMPAPPKVSAFAPAEDLVRQADQYVSGLEKIVADEEEYKDGKDKIAKDSNTLIVIALALGLHDQDNKYKANAGAVMKAAGELAATKDFASATKSVATLRDAAEGKQKVEGGELKWRKVASLPELMKQVPLVNTKLKRNLKPDKFKKKAKDTAGYTAVIAAIAQGSMADLSATKSPEQAEQWYKFSGAMRDDAGQLNAAIHKKDASAAAKAMAKLAQSCEDCHAVFHPGVKTDE